MLVAMVTSWKVMNIEYLDSALSIMVSRSLESSPFSSVDVNTYVPRVVDVWPRDTGIVGTYYLRLQGGWDQVLPPESWSRVWRPVNTDSHDPALFPRTWHDPRHLRYVILYGFHRHLFYVFATLTSISTITCSIFPTSISAIPPVLYLQHVASMAVPGTRGCGLPDETKRSNTLKYRWRFRDDYIIRVTRDEIPRCAYKVFKHATRVEESGFLESRSIQLLNIVIAYWNVC